MCARSRTWAPRRSPFRSTSHLEQVLRLVARAVAHFGRIDTFIANAMVTAYSEVERLEPEELRRVMDVNFFGVANSFWASLPALRKSNGTFLHVGSALAYRGIPLQAAYCASKAACRTLLESARVELQKAGDQVAVSVVLPGAIDTPQFDRDRQKIGYQPQPVPPIYEPEPFAEAVLHCCERPIRELPIGWGAQKAALGPEALAARRRLGVAPDRLERPAHGRAEADRVARQSLRDATRRSGRAWALLRAGAQEHGLDVRSAVEVAGLD